jgi:hypothetical protein
MTPLPEWPQGWPVLRTGLLAVRRAAAARGSGDRRAEERALVRLAEYPIFEGLRGDQSGVPRGRAILDHVGAVVSRVATDAGEMTPGQRRALALWARLVTTGVTAGGIAAEDPAVRAGRQSKGRAEKQIEAAMGLGGERSAAATRDAVKVLFEAVRAALTGRLPSAGGAATPDPAGVRYEWTGFAQRGEHAARSLLAVTAHLAAAPLPVVLLADGWGPLPAALRNLARRPPDLRSCGGDRPSPLPCRSWVVKLGAACPGRCRGGWEQP